MFRFFQGLSYLALSVCIGAPLCRYCVENNLEFLGFPIMVLCTTLFCWLLFKTSEQEMLLGQTKEQIDKELAYYSNSDIANNEIFLNSLQNIKNKI